MFAQKNLTVLSQHYAKLKAQDEEDSGDDFLALARKDHDVSDGGEAIDEHFIKNPNKKKAGKVRRAKEQFGLGKKLVFDEDGNEYDPFKMESIQEFAPTTDVIQEKQQEFINATASLMKEVDVVDKTLEKERRREIKRARKLKEKAIRREESGYFNDSGVTLANTGDGSDAYDDDESENDVPAKKQKIDLSKESLEELALQLLN